MSEHNDLNGLWSGAYAYALLGASVPITAWINEAGGRLSGSLIEPNTFVPDGPAELSATLDGQRIGLSLQFAKQYDPETGAHQTPISYEASVDDAFTQINGIWQFRQTGTLNGIFHLNRTSKGLGASNLQMAKTLAAAPSIR